LKAGSISVLLVLGPSPWSFKFLWPGPLELESGLRNAAAGLI
jgi:hypothetical protein